MAATVAAYMSTRCSLQQPGVGACVCYLRHGLAVGLANTGGPGHTPTSACSWSSGTIQTDLACGDTYHGHHHPA